jgi:hypothetical protein
MYREIEEEATTTSQNPKYKTKKKDSINHWDLHLTKIEIKN